MACMILWNLALLASSISSYLSSTWTLNPGRLHTSCLHKFFSAIPLPMRPCDSLANSLLTWHKPHLFGESLDSNAIFCLFIDMLCITPSQVLLWCIGNVPEFLYLLQKTMRFSGAGLYLTNFSISIPSLVPGINNLPRNINGINEGFFFLVYLPSNHSPYQRPHLITYLWLSP